jgi:hypothetical protein
VLSRLFRRLFLEGLTAAFDAGELRFFTNLFSLNDAKAFAAALAPLGTTEWVVYAKEPFAGPKQVLAYLARYTHRVAIANSRLLDLDQTHVSFRWKHYRESGGQKNKVMRLEIAEFIRRSSCTYCRVASIAFVTTARLPMATAPTSSRFAEACLMFLPLRRISRTMMRAAQVPPTTNHHRALAAAVA